MRVNILSFKAKFWSIKTIIKILMEVPKMKKNNCKLTEIKATAIQSNILRK
jgi:hypothetical protein